MGDNHLPLAGVSYERCNGIAIVAIDRPAVRNALTTDVCQALTGAIRRAQADDARALVLTGTGAFFCGGIDMGFLEHALANDPDEVFSDLLVHLNGLMVALTRVAMPTVSAVEGGAVGGGLTLALATDVCVAGRSARLSPRYLKLGLTPDGGLSYFLVRRLGPARSVAFLLQSPMVAAEQAATMGLVDEVVDDGTVFDRALVVATELAGRSATVVAGARALATSAARNSLEEQMEAESAWVARCWHDPTLQRYVSMFRVERAAR